MNKETMDKELKRGERESKRNMTIILGLLILIVGGVYIKGNRERAAEIKEITSEVKLSYVEELDLYIPYPYNYTPVVQDFTEIPETVQGREVETMILGEDDEIVLEGFILGDDEGYMVITVRGVKNSVYDIEEMGMENPGIQDLQRVDWDVTQDKLYEGTITDEVGRVQKVERYVRQIGINEVVVDVVHTLEGRSFLDIQHILDGIRRG